MEFTSEQLIDLSKNIQLAKVLSSNIAGIGYDETNKLMKVLFKGNSSYIYTNVEKETFDNIVKNESPGKQLNESVVKHKDKYKYMKL